MNAEVYEEADRANDRNIEPATAAGDAGALDEEPVSSRHAGAASARSSTPSAREASRPRENARSSTDIAAAS